MIDPLIAEHGGRVVKLTGDGFLAEFSSATDAVSAAMAMQSEISSRVSDVDEDRRVQFRMGINLGDILWDDEDIYGDGVNIAARIEALGDPGGILVSASIYDQVHHRVPAAFEDMGEHELKNIDTPLRIYRVLSGQPVEVAPATRKETATMRSSSSIAVLPLITSGENQEYADFADGLGADINTELSRSGLIFVVGYQVSKRHSLETESIEAIGQTLSVNYLLSGTVRYSGNRARISVELLEVRSGKPCWAERYDRVLDDPFDVQEEASRKIAGVVEPSIQRTEMDRIARSPPDDLTPHELMLRAWRVADEGTQEANQAARLDCEEAIRRDPYYSDAYTLLAWIYWFDYYERWVDTPDIAAHKALEYADKALSLNPKDYDALGARGAALYALGRFDSISQATEKLAKKLPANAEVLRYRADLLTVLGEHEEAMELLEYSLEINPEHDHWMWLNRGTCLLFLERFEEAIDALEQFKAKSKLPSARISLAAAYAAAGRKEDARAEFESLELGVNELSERISTMFRESDDRERFMKWVRIAAQID